MTATIRTFPEERGMTRVALMEGDEELSRTLIVPMHMRIGGAVVRMDGIGGVATPEPYRNRGYSRRVLEAAVDIMASGDAVMSTLYGIPHFYPRFGYATLGPEYVLALQSLETRAELPDGMAARSGRPGDLAAIQHLYRLETERAVGALAREDEWWVWAELESALAAGDEVRVIERGGRVCAYAWQARSAWWMQHWNRDAHPALRIGEAFASDHESATGVLAMCRTWASEEGFDACELGIPPSCRVAQAAMLQETRVTAQFHDEAEFMGRALNLHGLMRDLLPELQVRWHATSRTASTLSLRFVMNHQRVTLRGDETGFDVSIDEPGDRTIELTPGTLARLVMGGFPLRLVLAGYGLPEAALSILERLFPQGTPYIYPADRF